jgi:hypothetical protein
VNKNRVTSCHPERGAALFILLVFLASGCLATCTSQSSSAEDEVMAFGGKVGMLARTIQTETMFIQAELAKPYSNLHDMQEAQARIERAYLDIHYLGHAPEELKGLHDLWIEASFNCQYLTNLAVINGGGDLSSCLSQIDAVVKATEKYMPAQEESTKPNP